MNQNDITSLLPAHFDDHSRVWIYQSSRPFNEQQEKEIDEQLLQFTSQWNAHGAPVKGWGKLLFGRFVVLMADETQEAVSGCSTDSSVRVIKSIEKQYDCNLFDRLSITFLVKGKAEVLPMNQVQYALDKGYIQADTLLFNNLVSTKKEMCSHWLQALNESWLAPRLNFSAQPNTL
ncbi:hypothetical protein DBR32_07450 [Taibaiella sp. KBW10]|uniref:hypothetical protein n=1 Tax=Taibaiella sp. KBW10 TaxID=2153357 RepID=UPI000F59D29C|nr:hypothetical protein [Taibaiella sp. KBW10]RQO31769.1 hypothetical protein DBR32_07450 [Taibaiella sp. KBW10]